MSAYQKIVDKGENETNIQTEEELKLVLKHSFLGVMDGVKKAYNLNNGKDYSAFLEFIKAHINNLDFIKEDKSHRKIQGYNSQKKKELYELIETFKCRTYPLNKVIIKLTPRYLMHIAVGHIKHYKIPRKGKQIQFIHIQDWKLLVAVIDRLLIY